VNNTPNMRLELVPVPVSDVDRAKSFYAEKIGFHVDHDSQPSEGVRVIQLTPPGSACSIMIGKDVRETRDLLMSRGVEMGEIIEYPGGIKFCGFSDPDGNSWLLQEIPPGR
jgi:catechol 2,3-dioxygenase-like lactoylglutathione lyase family enzyme